MSQVIVTDDKLKLKRAASKIQEDHISREAMFDRWRRNDITGKDPLLALVGIAVSPIWAFWTVLTGLIYVVMMILETVFRGLGGIIGGKKSLITGRKSD